MFRVISINLKGRRRGTMIFVKLPSGGQAISMNLLKKAHEERTETELESETIFPPSE